MGGVGVGGGSCDTPTTGGGEGVAVVKENKGDPHLGGGNLGQKLSDRIIDDCRKDPGIAL